MEITVRPKPVTEKEATPLVQQTTYWARVKQQQGCHTRVFDINMIEQPACCSDGDNCTCSANDDLLVVFRRINSQMQMAYVPYGPNLLPEQEDRGTFLEELSETLRPLLPDDCLMIRYDLAWESPWADDEHFSNQHWEGPPEPRVQEMRMNFATKNYNLRKAPTDILPTNTIFMNLKKDDDILLRRMKPKTRYNIKLAKKRGVNVHEVDRNSLAVWYDLYKETACRNHINLQDIGYFRSVLNTHANESYSPAYVHLLLAEADGDALAGMFLVVSGKRATYLYGASSSRKRNLMPAYALQWEAMELAKKLGCTEYDMFGISPTPDPLHPMYGLYRFKSGFGGEIFHRQGCWDYPLNELLYENYRLAEANSQGFHHS